MQAIKDIVLKRYFPVLLGMLMIFLLSISFFWLYSARVFISRASSASTTSTDNSTGFATPQRAKADGIDTIRLYFFLLDDRGLGIEGKKVDVVGIQKARLQQVQAITDQAGKAIFDLTSKERVILNLTFEAGGAILPQKIAVTFY